MRARNTLSDGRARLIETDRFPFEFVSALAERESWRKEVYRPVYHVHKWWASRLGSVFRGIILGCLLGQTADLEEEFYDRHRFSDVSVFDPFTGSGTTVGEAHKLGCAALGRDINPVACESVRVALGALSRRQLEEGFSHLSATVGHQIRELYRCEGDNGKEADVLYYFWVKTVPCPNCNADVDLFSTYAFARNAYPTQKPEIQVYCPLCGNVFPALHTDDSVRCPACHGQFDPHAGPADGQKVTCQACRQPFSISQAIRSLGRPPDHRLYAKLILLPTGDKRYTRASQKDVERYRTCSAVLASEVAQGAIHLPDALLSDGNNTRQALGYNYHRWRDFFNDRQLLGLGWLQAAITQLPDKITRDAFLLLFSGVLEFNNLFASYKGEGTGAVRHMFSHHILKPERMPVEANIWGTPKSSGSFSNLFKSRILRLLDYRAAPFEVTLLGAGKRHRSSLPFSGCIEDDWPPKTAESGSIHISCGSSDDSQLPSESVDLVVTDPPFFDNVHYSELADFFFAWQKLFPRGFIQPAPSTRHPSEVQDADADRFAQKLKAVFIECRRVLKNEGLLAFTYHHSSNEGWTSLAEAIFGARFSVVNAHPVKAEMSVAAPKSQAKEPIQIDIIIVCRKQEIDNRGQTNSSECMKEAEERAFEKLRRLRTTGLKLSRNDCRVVLYGQFLSTLGPVDAEAALLAIEEQQRNLEHSIEHLVTTNRLENQAPPVQPRLVGL